MKPDSEPYRTFPNNPQISRQVLDSVESRMDLAISANGHWSAMAEKCMSQRWRQEDYRIQTEATVSSESNRANLENPNLRPERPD